MAVARLFCLIASASANSGQLELTDMKRQRHTHVPSRRPIGFALIGAGLLALATIARADYTGTVLYQIDTNINPPPGFIVSTAFASVSASGGQVVGDIVSSALPRVFDDGLLWKDAGTPITLTPAGASSPQTSVSSGDQNVNSRAQDFTPRWRRGRRRLVFVVSSANSTTRPMRIEASLLRHHCERRQHCVRVRQATTAASSGSCQGL